MSGDIKDITEAIPGLAPEIVDFLDRRLSMRPSNALDSHSFQVLNRQLSKKFFENTDPSTFLVGIGIRLAISPQVIVTTVSVLDPYQVMEDLHHAIRGVEISDMSAMSVLVELALHVVEQKDHASKESTEFIKRHLARLCIPKKIGPVGTAIGYICSYGQRRLSGVSHEVACGLVLPRKVQATFFLGDLNCLLKEAREICWVGFHGSQSGFQQILLDFIQRLIEAYSILATEWSRPKFDLTQFQQSSELFSLFGQVFMLLTPLKNGYVDLFMYTLRFIIQGADNVLDGIKAELGKSMRDGNLSWEGATRASIAFGPTLNFLRHQLLSLQKEANRPLHSCVDN